MGCCVSKPPCKYGDADLAGVPPLAGFSFHVLRLEHETEAVEVGTRSFGGSDGGNAEPLFEWMLGTDELPGGPEAKDKFVRAMQRWMFLQAQYFSGLVIGARDVATDKLVGTIIVYPPGTALAGAAQIPMFIHMTTCKNVPMPPTDAKSYGPYPVKRNQAVEKALDCKEFSDMKKAAQIRGNFCWKVEGLCVDPAAQGKGVSRALMSALFHLADASAAEGKGVGHCHVECGLEKLAPLYRKLGFTDGEAIKEIAAKGDPGPSFKLCSLLRKHGTTVASPAKNLSQVAPSAEPE